MLATLIALTLSLLFYFWPVAISQETVSIVLACTGGAFLLMFTFLVALLLGPLQRATSEISPRVGQLLQKNRRLWWMLVWMAVLPLASLAAALFVQTEPVWGHLLLGVWLFFTGVSIDFVRAFFRQVLVYFSPMEFVDLVLERAKQAIWSGDDKDLVRGIDSLGEMSLRAVERKSPSFSSYCLEGMSLGIQRFFEVHRRALQAAAPEAEIHQRANYVFYYSVERFEMIFSAALAARLDTVCNYVEHVLGKIAAMAAQGDVAKAAPSVRYIGTFALQAMHKDVPEIAVKANLLLVELSKLMLREVDLAKVSLEEALIPLVDQLEAIAKAMFKKDKESDLKVLTRSLRELKEVLAAEALQGRSDVAVVTKSIDRVLGDFQNLELILHTIPPIPKAYVEAETKAGTDLPNTSVDEPKGA